MNKEQGTLEAKGNLFATIYKYKNLVSASVFVFSGLLIFSGSVPYTGMQPKLVHAATTDTYTATGSWTAPAGVTSVDVEVWGAGGGGGGVSFSPKGFGGGGGAYSKKNSYAVTPGNSYTVTVGTGGSAAAGGGSTSGGNGGDSWFSTSGTVLAKGGLGGIGNMQTESPSLGGQAASGIGDIKYSGGTGGYQGSPGGGGGGGAGSTGDGGSAVYGSDSGGTGTSVGGGNGGNAQTATLPSAAGGGGYTEFNAQAASAGARGEVRITYSVSRTCTSITSGTGNWNSAGTWTNCGGGTPGVDDIAVIEGTATITVTASTTVSALNFGETGTAATGAVLAVNSGQTLTVTGAITMVGTAGTATQGTIQNGTGNGTVTATSVQIGSTVTPSSTVTNKLVSTINTLTVSGATTLTGYVSGAIYNNPALEVQSGTFSAASITTSLPNASNTATVSMATGAQSGTLKLSAASPWSLSGTGTNTTTLNGTGSTIEYSGTSQTFLNTTYTGLKVSGSSGTTAQNVTVAGLLNITGTMTPSSGTVTLNNGASISNSGTLTFYNLTIASGATATGNTSYSVAGTLTNSSTATFTSNSGTVTFNNASSIVNSGTSLVFNNFTIASAAIIALNTNFAVAGIFTNGPTGILNHNSGTVTLNNGASLVNSGSVLTFYNLTIASGATATGNTSYIVKGVLTNSSGATFTSNSGTVTMNNGSSIVNSGTSLSFTNLTITNSATVTANASYTVSGVLTVSSSAVLSPTSGTITLTGTGTPLVNSGTFSPSGSQTIQYTGATVNVAPVTFNNLTLGGTGTYTLPATPWRLDGNLVVTTGATVTKGVGTLTLGNSANTVSITGNATNSDLGTIVIGNSSAAKVVNLGSSIKVTAVTVTTGATLNANGANTLTITGNDVGVMTSTGPNSPGTMADDSATGTVTWTNPDNAKLSDNVYVTATGTLVPTHYLKATNFGFSIPTDATINGIVAEIESKASGYASPDSVKIVKSNGVIGTPNKSGTPWGLSDAYSTYGSSSDLWGESWTASDINNSNFGVVLYATLGSGIAPPSFPADTLISTPAGQKRIDSLHIGDEVYSYNPVTGNIEPAALIDVFYHPISDVGNTLYTLYLSDGTILESTPNHVFYANGQWVRADDLSIGAVLKNLEFNDVIIENIVVNQVPDMPVWDVVVENNHTFFAENILVHNPAGTGYVDHMRITVYYTPASGGTSPLVVAGTFTPSTGTVDFSSAGTTGTAIPALTYNNLTMNKASNTFAAAGAITANNLTLTAGTFVAPSGNLTLNGDLTNNGTFTHNSGTVVMSPATLTASINGASSTTFNNLTASTAGSTIHFKDGNTFTFEGALNVTGNSGSRIVLNSITENSLWTVTLSGTASLSYVNIQDGACSGGNTMSSNSLITNLGNSGSCWGFVGPISRGGGSSTGGGAGSQSVSNNNGGNSGGAGGTGGGAGSGAVGSGQGTPTSVILYPSTIVNDASIGNLAWASTSNAASNDALYANTPTAVGTQTTNYLKATNFGFSIPTNSTINGIIVNIERKKGTGTGATDNAIRIILSNGNYGTTNKSVGEVWAGGAGSETVYGTSSDLWGETWTYSDINNSNFGVGLSANTSAGEGGSAASVDYFSITVHYTPAAAPPPSGGGGATP
jgi:hypothetical protein